MERLRSRLSGPEFVTQYEGGLKSTFLNARAWLNAAAFYTRYSGIQLTNIITIQEPNGQALSGTTIDNAGAAHLEGAGSRGDGYSG